MKARMLLMAEYFCLQIPGWEWVQMWIVLAKHTSNVGFPAATFGKLGSASVRKMHFLSSKIWIADETFKNILCHLENVITVNDLSNLCHFRILL